MTQQITVEITINAPIEKVWEFWNNPEHITKWAFAGDWVCPRATNDLREGGKFLTRMESADGKEGFDLEGTYTSVENKKLIAYTMAGEDQRKVKTEFIDQGDSVKIIQSFDPENINPTEMQKSGWESILQNFKKAVESK